MGKLTTTTFVSLDGVMQAPGGPTEDPSGGFRHGGWLVPHFDDATGQFMNSVFQRVEAFLLGRRTYEIFAAHWPHFEDPNDPIASALNTLPKHVASRTLREVKWHNSSLLGPDLPAEVRRLKDKVRGELQVHGSCGLVQSLLQADLVDELNVLTFPVILGSGRRLFGPGTVPAALKLVSSQVTPNGIVIASYKRDGEVKTGSFELAP
jgi:dihydrofolate reductase